MKKILSTLVFVGLACSALSGCVDDNQYVVLRGITMQGACSPTGDNQDYVSSVTCNPTGGYGHLMAQIVNYVTGESPWSGGGGGSGTTFETTVPNPGMIFIEKIILSCDSVDGESSGCDGAEDIEIETNSPVSGSGGGVCLGISLDISKMSEWATSGTVVVDAYAKYHDSSKIKGETSHTKVPFVFSGDYGSCEETLVAAEAEDEDEGEGKGSEGHED